MKDIKIHSSTSASIKDLSKDLDISDFYWNNIFESIIKLFDKVYFIGHRRWVQDEELNQTIEYLSEEILIDEGKDHFEILLRLKTSYIMHNRRLVSKMWDYYEFPGFIFLGDNEDEEILLWAYKNRAFINEIVDQIDNVLIITRRTEPNVLWLDSNIGLKNILSFL